MTELSGAQKAAYRALIDGPVYLMAGGNYRARGYGLFQTGTMNSLQSIGVCRFDGDHGERGAMVLVLPIDQPKQGIWHHENLGSEPQSGEGTCASEKPASHTTERTTRGLRLIHNRNGAEGGQPGHSQDDR